MKRIIAVLSLAGLLWTFNIGTAVAAPKCKKAAPIAVELITSGFDFTLTEPRQIKAPTGGIGAVDPYAVWFVAGTITGGAADGQIGTWIRVKLNPDANGLFIAFNDAAKIATPELGELLDPINYTDLSSKRYGKVVKCAERAAQP